MRETRLVGITAIGPMLWGTNYLVTSEVIPQDVPLLAAAVRALPAGILLLVVVALRDGTVAVPRGAWWWRAPLLGALNIGVFFVLFFVAAYRLPGGVAAVLGALGPFLVAGLSYPILGERPGRRVLVAATIGVAGVALLVLRSAVRLDPIGIAAAAGGMAAISVATVLGKRWGLPPAPSPGRGVLALTSWQLISGGLLVLPVALAVETLPAAVTPRHLLGLAYLALVGTCVAHFLWFQGVSGLAPTQVTLLSLLSPVVATILGWAVLGQSLSVGQFVGAVAVLGAVLLGSTAAPVRVSLRPARSRAPVPQSPTGR